MNSWRRAARVLKEIGAKTARVALDADARRNPVVARCLSHLIGHLCGKGFTVELEVWKEEHGKGIDDLLAAGHQPTIIQGESVVSAVQEIVESAGVFDSPGSAPSDSAANGNGILAVDIIRSYFRSYYHPTFRRGAVLYSDALGREIRASEACFAPDTRLVDKLSLAPDCPKSENGPIRGAIPKLFKTWAPVAWRDVLDKLPEEEATAEVVGSAAEDFRAKVASGLHTHISLSYEHQGSEVAEVQRRSLIAWASLFAKPGSWQPVRNYLLWCRRDAIGGPLRVAVRVGLFASGQAHLRGLSEMNQYPFAHLCEQYGVGTAQRACGQRVVELTQEFIAELLETPALEKPEQLPEQRTGVRVCMWICMWVMKKKVGKAP